MILKDVKGNLFELDDLLTSNATSTLSVQNHEDCENCPYKEICEEDTFSENSARILFFEVSPN